MFALEPTRITKELLLNKFSEEEYMSFYLGIIPSKGLFTSPLRPDKNPTCSFYRNKTNELIFKDFGNGFSGNFVSVVMLKFGVNYGKALNIIANDFKIMERPDYNKNVAKVIYNGSKVDETLPANINCQIKEFTEEELEWWLKQGISLTTLQHFKVFSVEHVFLNGVLHSSSSKHSFIFGYYFGKKDGIERWKIYFPFRTSYRFMGNSSLIQGLRQLPDKGDNVVITKSLKDVMAFYELGISAIAPQAESIVLTQMQFKSLAKKYVNIFVNGDWDRAGQTFMIKSRNTYPCICLAFRKKKEFGKDLTDFIRMHGFEKACSLRDKVQMLFLKGRFNYQLKYSKV